MNRKTEAADQERRFITGSQKSGIFSKCSRTENDTNAGLEFGQELVELCAEISGALLRGYADGKSGHQVRQMIVQGLEEKIRCPRYQAQSLVDLSLELIHFQAFGRFKQSSLELSFLAAKCGGHVEDVSLN